MQMVQEAVDRGVRQLGGSQGPAVNAGPLQGNYALPARTAEEVKVAPAAHQGHVQGQGMNQQAVQQQNQALANGQMDMFAHLQQTAAIADPAAPLGQGVPNEPRPMQQVPPAVTPGGLILPQGVEPPAAPPSSVPEPEASKWLL